MALSLESRITLRQLRIFVTVVEQGSFTRAAARLSLTQPAVTHQIQALARAVGQPLLDPGSRAPVLTASGQALHACAGRILATVGDAQDAMEDIVGLRAGRVRVAGDTTVGIYILPDAMAVFHREHPGVQVSLDVINRARVRELLLTGGADIGVVGTLWDDDLLVAEPFLENSLMCFSAPNHPLVGREPLRPADLLDGPLLLREPGSGTRESAERILRDAGTEPIAAMEMASNGALKRAVAGGLGVTVLSTYAVRLELQLGLLRPLRVDGFPARRQWHVTWARNRLLSPATAAFKTFLHSPDWRDTLSLPLGGE